ncbi:DUF1028 domain-containing protein [Chryseobacterium sp. IT-36CA2]|uniref:DUF1028 domain-containing protein n=1 Tax=Chryseobacterium sp. IT-36CA2 TaxID=3026460 RepID=UPI0039E04044
MKNKLIQSQMKSKLFFTILFFSIALKLQATLSIVGVDPATGKVGTAGFTCICNFDLRNNIAMLVPGKGAFNTQASTGILSFPNAKNYLESGYNAFEAINANIADKQDINVSQLLAATLNPGTGLNVNGSPNAFAFTGKGNGNVNYYRYGQNFAIAGNILISKAVLDDAYNAFLNNPGELEDKLMAALLAAKRPGADSRCLPNGTSSSVAYIAVAKPMDPFNKGFLELQYINPCGVNKEPIDILYRMFKNWKNINAGLPANNLPILNITSISNNRQPSGDRGYTFDGDKMENSRAKVLNADNFGVYGYSGFKTNITDAFDNQGSITQTVLNNLSTDLFFIGTFNKAAMGPSKNFTIGEINEAYNWSLTPNKTVFLFESGGDGNSFFSKWGYQLTQEIANPNKSFIDNSSLPISKKIFSGPFGNITSFQQGGGTQSYFSKMPLNAVVLGVNANNKPVLVYDCTTRDILCADTDIFTSLGTVSTGLLINNDNDRILSNLINLAYEMKENLVNLPACNNVLNRISVDYNKIGVSETERKIDTEINIYPNPVRDNFTIDLNSFKNQNLKISIYNQSQNLLFEKTVSKTNVQKVTEIDGSSLPEGVLYVVVTDSEENKKIKKIIIKH